LSSALAFNSSVCAKAQIFSVCAKAQIFSVCAKAQIASVCAKAQIFLRKFVQNFTNVLTRRIRPSQNWPLELFYVVFTICRRWVRWAGTVSQQISPALIGHV